MDGNTSTLNQEAIKLICEKFLVNTGYCRPDIQTVNEPLEFAMRTLMYEKKIECPKLEQTLQLSASLIQLSCYESTLPEKLNATLINWFVMYASGLSIIDDKPYIEFPHRLLKGQMQLDPVLEALNEAMISLFDYYDAPVANNIIASTVEHISMTFIGSQIIHDKLTVANGAFRFPQYLRSRTGLGIAFTFFPFSKSKGVKMEEYICAVPDIEFWICGTNDLLSYYRETLCGGENNYVMTRAVAEGKDSLQVLTELEQELQTSRNAIYKLLSLSPGATRAWRVFEEGYIMWHMELYDKYRPNDLGLTSQRGPV